MFFILLTSAVVIWGVAHFIIIHRLFKKYEFLKNPEIIYNEVFPAFTRPDRILWNKPIFFLVGFFTLPFRLALLLSCFFFCCMAFKIVIFIYGVKDLSGPQKPEFLKSIHRVGGWFFYPMLWSLGYFKVDHKLIEPDPRHYEEYFVRSPDSKKATIISNHMGPFDGMFFHMLPYVKSYIASHVALKYPFISTFSQIAQAIFVRRTNKESRSDCLRQLKERAEGIRKKPQSKQYIEYDHASTDITQHILNL